MYSADEDFLIGPALSIAVGTTDLVQYFQSFRDLPENRVNSVKPLIAVREHYEELGGAHVRPAVSHGNNSDSVMSQQGVELVREVAMFFPSFFTLELGSTFDLRTLGKTGVFALLLG